LCIYSNSNDLLEGLKKFPEKFDPDYLAIYRTERHKMYATFRGLKKFMEKIHALPQHQRPRQKNMFVQIILTKAFIGLMFSYINIRNPDDTGPSG